MRATSWSASRPSRRTEPRRVPDPRAAAPAKAAIEVLVASQGHTSDIRGALSLASTEGHLAIVPEPD